MIPEDPNTLLTRPQVAVALTEAGFPTSPATLSTKATRGGGPPYQKFGPRVLYTWGVTLKWAKDRLRGPVHSTSETASQRTDARRVRQEERTASEASASFQPVSEGTARGDVETSVGARDV
jgi:hypothetical protein